MSKSLYSIKTIRSYSFSQNLPSWITSLILGYFISNANQMLSNEIGIILGLTCWDSLIFHIKDKDVKLVAGSPDINYHWWFQKQWFKGRFLKYQFCTILFILSNSILFYPILFYKTTTLLRRPMLSPPKKIPRSSLLYKTTICLTRPLTNLFVSQMKENLSKTTTTKLYYVKNWETNIRKQYT